jgi:hypothetical protein
MRKLFVFVLMLMLLVPAVPALAQEAGPEKLPAVDIHEAGEALLRFVSTAILGGFITAPTTTVIVAILKRLSALRSVSAEWLAFVVGAVLYVLVLVAGAVGYEAEFRSFLDLLTTILPAVSGFVLTLLGAGATYQLAKKTDAPVIGYERGARSYSARR